MPTSIVASTGKPILDKRRGNKGTMQPWRQDQVRQQIQVRSILNLIQNHILGVEGYEDVKPTRLHYGMKLIDKVLPNAIPDAVTTNLQANTLQALQSINQAQLLAMAQEMLANQALTIDAQPGQLVPTNVSTHSHVEISSGESEQLLTDENSTGGVGKGGVAASLGSSTLPVAQESSYPYPDILPDELG